MKNNKISTKIRIIGAMLIVAIFTVIASTIYLNEKNIKDSLRINIAGKQRMLTQKIAKNVFFINKKQNADFKELEKAVDQFKSGLNILKNGNELLGIKEAPTKEIVDQISRVELHWDEFEKSINNFKISNRQNDMQKLSRSVKFISQTNNDILHDVDILVTLFTKYSEEKTNFTKKFQYVSLAILFYLVVYSILQLRQIETHAREFMEKSKQMANIDTDVYEQINVEAESEIVEVADNLNCFINKLNSAMQYSSQAIEQSQHASKKLEELTDEFDTIIGEIENSSTVLNKLDKSEDIALDSTESMLKTTKKLQNLKEELNSLLVSCKEH